MQDPQVDNWDEHRPDGTRRKVWLWSEDDDKWLGPFPFCNVAKGDIFTAENQDECPGIYVALAAPVVDPEDPHGRYHLRGVQIPGKDDDET